MNHRFYFPVFYVIVISIIVLFSCTNQKKLQETKSQQSLQVSNYISEYFSQDDSIEIIPNENTTLILYLSRKIEERINPIGNINFFVYDKTNDTIVYKNEFIHSKIVWYSNNELLLTQYFGIIKQDNLDNKEDYIINVKTGKKRIYQQSKLK